MKYNGFEINDEDNQPVKPGCKPIIHWTTENDLGFELKIIDELNHTQTDEWLQDLLTNHKDIRLIYPDHLNLVTLDPGHTNKDFNEDTADGHLYMDGHSWYTFDHYDDISGPTAPMYSLRIDSHKDSFDPDGPERMEYHPRSCFKGYLKQYIENLPFDIRTPWLEQFPPDSREITHNYKSLWSEVLIPLQSNENARIVLRDSEVHQLSQYKVYLFNRSIPFKIQNFGKSDLYLFKVKVNTLDVLDYLYE